MQRHLLLAGLAIASIGNAGLHAQFPQSLTLPATSSAVVLSAATKSGWQYTITITGTYSMWPPYEARGVDAAYVYDVPAAEIASLRWPPVFIYPIPHWVGDTLEVPPVDIPGLQFKFRTRDNIGFRINGQPLVDRGLDAGHRYQMTVVGNGGPIEFQILDSALSLSQGRIIPRYEDNSGTLAVSIEERPFFNLCDLRQRCVDGSKQLAITASLLNYDSAGRARNVLGEGAQALVSVDGQLLPVDSISCSHRLPIAYSLVVDRSGSMDWQYEGPTTRLQALKSAALGFLKTLRAGDQVELITFSYDDDITLDVPWTSDTARIGAGIRRMTAEGGTAWRDAAWYGLGEASRHYNPLRAVVLITDGDDTHSRRTLESVAIRAQALNVPVFAIGLALVDSSERPLRYLAARSNGRFFQARDRRQIDSVFSNLSREIASDECCTVYVTIPRSITRTPAVRRVEVIADAGSGLTPVFRQDLYIDDSCATSGVTNEAAGAHLAGSLNVMPNPSIGSAVVEMNLPVAGRLKLRLVTPDGTSRDIVPDADYLPGIKRFALDLSHDPSGLYVVSAELEGRQFAAAHMVVAK